MDDNEELIRRRVYELPVELVDRIVQFQKEKKLPSEVEAARRLLDQALKVRDSLENIVGRYLAHLEANHDSSDAARDILVGHPLIKSIKFNEESVEFLFEKSGDDAEWINPISRDYITRSSTGGYSSTTIYQYDGSKKAGLRLFMELVKGSDIDSDVPF